MTAPSDVTIVVPVRDEALTIDDVAAAIAAQVSVPAAVIFVDGGSQDDTAQILQRWAVGRPSWTVIEAGPATPGRGRNLGIEAASTPWIALTDAGMMADKHWLERLIEAAREHPDAEVVYGHREIAARGFWGSSKMLAYLPPMTASDRGPIRSRLVACSLVRREVWARVGGFPDLRAAEDGIFLRRLTAAEVTEAFAPEATVASDLGPSLAATFQRLRLYSRVNVEAGEQSEWHHGVARQWLVAAPFLVAGLRWRRLWALPALAFVARVAKSIAVRREGRSMLYVANPVRLAGVATVLLTCDAATFAGWLDAVRDRRRARPVRG